MGRALATLHQRSPDPTVPSQTASEVANVRRVLTEGDEHPPPYQRVSSGAIEKSVATTPDANEPVWTHGSPVVSSAVLVDSVVVFESGGADGFDPPERDLAIALRSIAETFTSEVARTFLEGYEEAGGQLPKIEALDWYGLLAAFR